MQKVGGPGRAAEIKRARVREWEGMAEADAYGPAFARSCREKAVRFRAEAEALRALARGTSNTRSGLSGAPERRERGS